MSMNIFMTPDTYYVLNDERSRNGREAFVVTSEEADRCFENYSGYYTIETFETEKEAKEFCTKFNNYEGEEPVELSCCSRGCTMSAFDYGHWNGCCAYEGQ